MIDFQGQIIRSAGAVLIASLGAEGETPSAELSKNGAAFVACSNSVTEISDGYYRLVLSSPETNTAGLVVVRFLSNEPEVAVGILIETGQDFLSKSFSQLATKAEIVEISNQLRSLTQSLNLRLLELNQARFGR